MALGSFALFQFGGAIMRYNMPGGRMLLGSLVVLLTCLGCVSEAKKRPLTHQINVLAIVQDITTLFNEAQLAAAAHAATEDARYAHEVTRLIQEAQEACDRVREMMFAPANRERIHVMKEHLVRFNELDNMLEALNHDLRNRRAERTVAANGVYMILSKGREIVFNTATAHVQMVEIDDTQVEDVDQDRLNLMARIAAIERHLGLARIAEIDDTQVEFIDRDRLNSMALIGAIERHFGLAQIAAMNYEMALEQADRDRFWLIFENELRAIHIEYAKLENYIVTTAGRQALEDLRRFLAEWQIASNSIGGIIRTRAGIRSEVKRLSELINDLLSQLHAACFHRIQNLIEEL